MGVGLVICCLCVYYDEKPSWLAGQLASLAPVCDAFVYLDGAYALYPGATRRPASDIDCAHTLHDMAKACGVSLLHYRPTSPFVGNEVEKRELSVRLARQLPGVDETTWFLVADADTVATKVSPLLPHDLANTDLLVAEYGWETPHDPEDDVAVTMGAVAGFGVTKVRGLYRNIPGLTYGPAHYVVSGFDPDTGERGWLWGDPRLHQPYAKALDVSQSLLFEHRRARRADGRNQAAKTYYDARDATGVERMGRSFVRGVDGEYVEVSRGD